MGNWPGRPIMRGGHSTYPKRLRHVYECGTYDMHAKANIIKISYFIIISCLFLILVSPRLRGRRRLFLKTLHLCLSVGTTKRKKKRTSMECLTQFTMLHVKIALPRRVARGKPPYSYASSVTWERHHLHDLFCG